MQPALDVVAFASIMGLTVLELAVIASLMGILGPGRRVPDGSV